MNSVVTELERLDETLAGVARDAFGRETIPDLSDAEIAALLAASGRIQRRVEALQIEAAVQVNERSAPMRDDRITLAYGCSTAVDLIRMLTFSDSRHAHRLVRAAGYLKRTRSITEGVFLPARYPALRSAVTDGYLGLSGLLAAIAPLEQARARILDEQRLEADRQLGALARGIDTDLDASADADETYGNGPLPTPEDLGLLAQVLVAYLDPDGAEPTDDAAARTRSFTVGRQRKGTVPVRGDLLPEVAGQLQLLLDSLLNPRVDGPDDPSARGVHFAPSADDDDAPDVVDSRTRTQKRHDAFAAILNTIARTGALPTLGGAAPTLVVSVTAQDYATGTGWATVQNTGDLIPTRVAAQTACAGGIQRILFDSNGRMASIGTSSRIFNAAQRRAITLRDGGCIIPGCTIPATWCEIHHVQEYADGGPTHTDNGVLLCWWHHRNLHLSEWRIRVNDGVPEVRGPLWWDREQRWRPAGRPRPHRRQPATV